MLLTLILLPVTALALSRSGNYGLWYERCTTLQEADIWVSGDSACVICQCKGYGRFSCNLMECYGDLECGPDEYIRDDGCCPYCASLKNSSVTPPRCTLPNGGGTVGPNTFIQRNWCGTYSICRDDGVLVTIEQSCFSMNAFFYCVVFAAFVMVFTLGVWFTLKALFRLREDDAEEIGEYVYDDDKWDDQWETGKEKQHHPHDENITKLEIEGEDDNKPTKEVVW